MMLSIAYLFTGFCLGVLIMFLYRGASIRITTRTREHVEYQAHCTRHGWIDVTEAQSRAMLNGADCPLCEKENRRA